MPRQVWQRIWTRSNWSITRFNHFFLFQIKFLEMNAANCLLIWFIFFWKKKKSSLCFSPETIFEKVKWKDSFLYCNIIKYPRNYLLNIFIKLFFFFLLFAENSKEHFRTDINFNLNNLGLKKKRFQENKPESLTSFFWLQYVHQSTFGFQFFFSFYPQKSPTTEVFSFLHIPSYFPFTFQRLFPLGNFKKKEIKFTWGGGRKKKGKGFVVEILKIDMEVFEENSRSLFKKSDIPSSSLPPSLPPTGSKKRTNDRHPVREYQLLTFN